MFNVRLVALLSRLRTREFKSRELKDVRAKFSNIDFSLKILPLKDDELLMSEM